MSARRVAEQQYEACKSTFVVVHACMHTRTTPCAENMCCDSLLILASVVRADMCGPRARPLPHPTATEGQHPA